mgnify:FL=1
MRYLVSSGISMFLARRLWRKMARWGDLHLVRNPVFSPYFEKYQPQCVFLANLFDEMEIALLREAKQRKVPTIGFIGSWDKITTKGFIRILPDRLMVPNRFVWDEARIYADADQKTLSLTGMPSYDQYAKPDGILSREEFFKKIGCDPATHLMVLAPPGASFGGADWDVIDFLHALFEDGEIQDKVSLLVRFQPNDFSHPEELAKRPWLHYDIPGIRFSTKRGTDWDMTPSELLHLKNTLFHSSLVLTCGSSIGIDAAIFGKPVITLNFETQVGRPPLQNPILRYGTVHIQRAFATGGMRLVNNKEELLAWIHAYLEDPSLDEEKRRQLVQTHCWRVDGRAGERIANGIIEALTGTNHA